MSFMTARRDKALALAFIDAGFRVRDTAVGLIAQQDDMCWVFDWDDYVDIRDVDDERRRIIKESWHKKARIDIRDARHYDAMLIYRKGRRKWSQRKQEVEKRLRRANPGCEEGGRSMLSRMSS